MDARGVGRRDSLFPCFFFFFFGFLLERKKGGLYIGQVGSSGEWCAEREYLLLSER